MPTRLAVIAAVLFSFTLASSARAELEPGWYATGCAKLRPSKTQAAAKKRCKRPSDVVHVTTKQPVFWVASFSKGKTRAEAVKACRADAKKHSRQPPSDTDLAYCDSDVSAAYGPFDRKKDRGGYDDIETYRYLTDNIGWVDEHGEGPCFVSGTLIATPEGERAIESLAVGDSVWSWSPELGRMQRQTIVHTKSRAVASVLDVTLADGRTLALTDNHPLWSPSRAAWVLAGTLQVGDTLAVKADDALVTTAVTSLSSAPLAGPVTVWDLTVVPAHSYFAGGVWAHNY